ncbi:putative pentatricopeptide repeat-containing protein [Tripterygium wilfordii]|uniref:Putative pentatricopeptide repeat-containing protein n=1 Tax=Tripterygium wilfordii TaxID=458696 RepID=A0A7J7CR13_TRIWF|nr:pentatricopeptide repeat-containing protein At3g56030, mitochondrial [Tripterygium wilfordii]KAF5736553.1 putative pentatricopeptide repeat-containing protein [Tripterygium wilfordii]
MSLSILRKVSRKVPNPQPILSITARFFAARGSGTDFPDEPTAAYYDDLVNEAARERDWDTVRYLLNKRVRDHCFNTSNTFRFLTNTESSLSVLDDLSKALARLDKGFPRKSAYDLLIARLCKLQRIKESFRVVDVMAEGGHGLSECSFHPILNALTKKKKMEDSLRLLEAMRSMGCPPDLTAYNYLLTAYCYDGNVTAACGVMDKIEEEGLGADSRTYDALVLGACRAGKVEGALALFRRMEDDGLHVLYSSHVHVISELLNLGYYAHAVRFVRICGGRDKMLDTESFGLLASRLIRLQAYDEANTVLKEMNENGLEMGSKLRDYYLLNVRT